MGAREICWVKYELVDVRVLGWDDEWVYHRVDHGLDGNTGRVVPIHRRPLAAAQDADVGRMGDRAPQQPHQVVHGVVHRGPASRASRVDDGPNLYPMSQRAWIETRDAGALGVRDVLILASASHAPGAAPGVPERFYFARGAGWCGGTACADRRSFDRIGGPAVGARRRVRALIMRT